MGAGGSWGRQRPEAPVSDTHFPCPRPAPRDLPHPFYACSCIWVFFQTMTFVTFEISLLLGGEGTLGTTAVMSPKARPPTGRELTSDSSGY